MTQYAPHDNKQLRAKPSEVLPLTAAVQVHCNDSIFTGAGKGKSCVGAGERETLALAQNGKQQEQLVVPESG